MYFRFKMKRNVKSVFKFLILAVVTALVTVVLFRIVRTPNLQDRIGLSRKRSLNQDVRKDFKLKVLFNVLLIFRN